MNIAEFSKALSRMPMHYKILPRELVNFCEFNGILFACNVENNPVIYDKGEWRELITNAEEGMALV